MFRPAPMTVGERRRLHNITPADVGRVTAYGAAIALPAMDEVIAHWYVRLSDTPEYTQHFADADVLDRVRHGQADYWREFFSGDIDDYYVASRQRIGTMHARTGLSLRIYFAGMSWFADLWFDMDVVPRAEEADIDDAMAMKRLLDFDTALVAEAYEIAARDTMDKLSVPIMAMWTGVVLLPVVGHVDTARGMDILRTLVNTARLDDTRMVILDTSGMPAVTADRGLLVERVITDMRDVKGCKCIVTGPLALAIMRGNARSPNVVGAATLSEAIMLALREVPAG